MVMSDVQLTGTRGSPRTNTTAPWPGSWPQLSPASPSRCRHCPLLCAALSLETGFTRDGAALALKLRTVEAELGRVAALLEGSQTDTIPYYNENTRAEEMDYRRE